MTGFRNESEKHHFVEKLMMPILTHYDEVITNIKNESHQSILGRYARLWKIERNLLFK